MKALWVFGALLSSTNAVASQESWTVAATPVAAVPYTGDDEASVFHRVSGVLRAPAGELIVADGASKEIRVFSESGTHVRSFGGLGDGPREFRALSWIEWCGGNSIVAFDQVRFRITQWSIEGELVDEFVVEGPTPRSPPLAVSCDRGGQLVAIGWPDISAVDEAGPYRGTVPVGTVGDGGRRGELLVRVPGSERLRTENNDRPHPFGRATTVRYHAGRVYIGTADSLAFSVVSPGQPQIEIAVSGEGVVLTRDRTLRWIDVYLEAAGAPQEQRASLRTQFLDSEWMPETAPAYAGFLLDESGRIWVEPLRVPWDGTETSADWLVLDADGRIVARCSIPLELTVFGVDDAELFGVSVDPDTGIETPVVMRVIENPG